MKAGHDRSDWVVAGLIAVVLHAIMFYALINSRGSPPTIPDLPDTRDTTVVEGAGLGTGPDAPPAHSIIGCDYRIEGDSARLLESVSAGAASAGSGRIGCPAALHLNARIDSADVRIAPDQDGIPLNVNVRSVHPAAARDSLRTVASRWQVALPTAGRILPAYLAYAIKLRR